MTNVELSVRLFLSTACVSHTIGSGGLVSSTMQTRPLPVLLRHMTVDYYHCVSHTINQYPLNRIICLIHFSWFIILQISRHGGSKYVKLLGIPHTVMNNEYYGMGLMITVTLKCCILFCKMPFLTLAWNVPVIYKRTYLYISLFTCITTYMNMSISRLENDHFKLSHILLYIYPIYIYIYILYTLISYLSQAFP